MKHGSFLWRRLLSWFMSKGGRYTFIRVTDLPEELRPKTVYVVAEGGHDWFAAMVCPCGCGAILHLNLVEGMRPRWRVREHWDGTVTLYPSVWRQVGCCRHFILRCGRMHWCDTTT